MSNPYPEFPAGKYRVKDMPTLADGEPSNTFVGGEVVNVRAQYPDSDNDVLVLSPAFSFETWLCVDSLEPID